MSFHPRSYQHVDVMITTTDGKMISCRDCTIEWCKDDCIAIYYVHEPVNQVCHYIERRAIQSIRMLGNQYTAEGTPNVAD